MCERTVNVLLIEDNESDVDMLREVIEMNQYKVDLKVIDDGARALSSLRDGSAGKPDLIVLDLNLPRKSGREVLHALKGDPGLRELPVAILTSSSDPHEMRGCRDGGAAYYGIKPLGWDAYRREIELLADFWIRNQKSGHHSSCS